MHKGYTLLELLIACTISMTILFSSFGFFFRLYSFWQQGARCQQEQEELSLVMDAVRETVWGGTVLGSSTADRLNVKDELGRTVSFYLKNDKVCMYKNSTFYLTTDTMYIKDLQFFYRPGPVPEKVSFTMPQGKVFSLYI